MIAGTKQFLSGRVRLLGEAANFLSRWEETAS